MRFKQLETERLCLRQLKHSDYPAISYLRSDKIINEFVTRPAAETKEQALAFIAKIHEAIAEGNICYWAITENRRDEMIGSICLWNFSKDGRSAEVGYDLGLIYQRKGIMNEALSEVLKYGFNILWLTAIEAYTHRGNESSISLLVKSGFAPVLGKTDPSNTDNVVFRIQKDSPLHDSR